MATPRWLFRNPGLKIFSLAIAVAVWFALSGERRERTSERSYHIPLSIVNIPLSSLIASPLPATVEVRLRGPFTAVRQLDPDKLEAVIDLSNAEPGERVYRLTPEDVNVPPDVEAISFSPQDVHVVLDTVEEREIAVAPAIIGEPASGTRVVEARAEPAIARVVGPSGVLAKMSSIPTTPISVTGRSTTFSTPATLLATAPEVRVRQNQLVTVTVRIEPLPAATPRSARKRSGA